MYVFAFLRWLTIGGNIRAAQYVFALIYITTQAVVLWLYIKAKVRLRPCFLPNHSVCAESARHQVEKCMG